MYGRSKLMNILFTRELARRLADTGVTANSLHPGFVATRFADNNTGLFPMMVKAAKRFALTPEQGARTIVYLASSPDVGCVTGRYFHECKEESPTSDAQNDADARQLWDVSLYMSGLGAAVVS